jgi:alkanesulfonate monooxygenase SsuD/methylene tetrahydromethanopterin reductase-like flavin-dependent oxidoreductase (luciferase family)
MSAGDDIPDPIGGLGTGPAGPVTYGIRLPNSGPLATADAILRVAGHAHRLGFGQLWVHDHISWPQDKLTHYAAGSIEICTDQDANFFESLSTVALLLGAFPGIGVGVAGLVTPLRDPRVLAKQLTTIERLSGSRVTVVCGVGAIENDFHVMGVPFNRRGRITDEYLAALRCILAAPQPVDVDGPTLSFTNGTFLPRPRRLPIWVAGASEPAFRRAARFGDGWMTVYCTPAEYAAMRDRVRTNLDATGRDPSHFGLAYETFVCVGRTHEEALDTARASLAYGFGTEEGGRAVCFVGTADGVAEQIAAYTALGVGHVELKFICRDLDQLDDMMSALAGVLGPSTARGEESG